jgi:hypothetical protein
MADSTGDSWLEWAARIGGGVVVAGAAYFLLSYTTLWEDFNRHIRLGAAVGLGILFIIAGKPLWRWIGELIDWT